jgi:hypothetical protein
MKSDALLDQAEMEYGPKVAWQEKWVEDSMFVPFQPYEREDLYLESDDDGFLQPAECLFVDRKEDWDGNTESPRKCQLFIPAGMIVWMECNHPGRIYISGHDQFNWSDFNGYFPCEITWDFAMAMITSGDGDGPWNLEVCGPLDVSCKAEMERVCVRTP